MTTASTRTVLAATLLGGSMGAWALGLGPARITAVLGQPLELRVPLQGDAGEPVSQECIAARVFFGEDRIGGHQVRLRLEPASAAGEQWLRLSTTAVVNEPVVSIQVTAGCGAAIVREFVAFADPPSTQKTPPPSLPVATLPPAAPGPEPAAPRREDHASAAGPAVTKAAGTKGAARAEGPPTARRAPAPRSEPGTNRKLAAGQGEAAPAAAPAAPRLQLDPLLLASPEPAASAASEGAGMPGPAAAPDLAEAARVQALEATLAEVRSEMAATRRMLEGLEARALAAEQDREQNMMIAALAALGLLLSAALGWLLLERRRDRRAAAWGEGRTLVGEPELEAAPAAGAGSTAPEEARAEAVVSGPELRPAEAAMDIAPSPASMDAPVRRHPVLEDLLDLDQQAAFLVELGQEPAAVELLQSHIDRGASTSPLPWLELLALHQHRGDREAFDALARGFAERFGSGMPAWGTDLRQGCALEDYPAVIEQLEWNWQRPDQVALLLETLLLRSGGPDNMPDLPACQDLLLLYALVRERLGHEAVTASLDAELPWGFAHADRRRHVAGVLAPPAPPPVPELPPMPWPGEGLHLPEDAAPVPLPLLPALAGAAATEPAPAPAPAAEPDLEELLRALDFEPLQFEPAELAVSPGRA